MKFNTSFFAIVATLLTAGSLVTGMPLPCSDATRDAILRGDMDASACCNYGVCKGEFNSGTKLNEIKFEIKS